jgi:hypothetical protein
MKPIKMFGLAALVGLLAMAFAGTSSAMAGSTALCRADESTCAAVNLLGHPHATTLSGKKAKIVSSGPSTECDVLFLGDAETNLASPLVISGSFTYSNCTNNCTILEENGPATIEALKSGQETANLTLEFLIHMTCSGIHCYFSGVLEGVAKGPLLSLETSGEELFKEAVLSKEKGFFCPATAQLDAAGTPLTARYIAS